MYKKNGLILVFIAFALVTLSNTPPTDPDGYEVVFMSQGPTGPVTYTNGTPPTDQPTHQPTTWPANRKETP